MARGAAAINVSPAEAVPDAVPTSPPAADEARRAAERDKKRRQRGTRADPSSSTVSGRPGRTPGANAGNPLRFSPAEGLGDPLTPAEATRNIKAAHLALIKIVRSRVRVDDLDEEFTTAGQSYSDVANHMLPWLRILPRLIAPLILVGALLAIWAAILLETPWLQAWRERRRGERQQRELERQMEAAAAAEGSSPSPPSPPPSPASRPPAAPTIVRDQVAEQPVEHPPVPELGRGYRRLG